MKIELKIKSLQTLLDKSLSLVERGVLVSLVLTKDADPEIHWAKYKTKVTQNEESISALISLHKKKMVDWSGFEAKKQKLSDDSQNETVKEVLDFMNDLYGTQFRYSKHSTQGIVARLRDFSVDEIKLVISNRWEEWKDDAAMSKYLTPQTIFRPSKFEKYLVAAQLTKVGEGRLKAHTSHIKKGDLLTVDNTVDLSDKDTYQVKRCVRREDGSAQEIGATVQMLYGKDLKKNIRMADNLTKRGLSAPFIYIYWQD